MQKVFIDGTIDQAERMIREGMAVDKILTHLVFAAEKAIGGNSVSSILLLDEQGLLRNGASPRLPFDYLKAIDGLQPSPAVGTCAAAAATGTIVFTPDFMDDDKWAELRHLPLALGFMSAWSVPIKNTDGKVLGTFGTYCREKKIPLPQDIDVVSRLAVTAATALLRGN